MKRRKFLSTTVLGGTIAFRSVHTSAVQEHRLKVGQIGTKHAHAAGQMQTIRGLTRDFEVIGVVEPDEQQWQRVQNSPAYRDLPRLSESELLEQTALQVVAVETEVRDLLSTAQRCVDAGKHIHIDKPAGESLPRLKKLQSAARDQSVTIQMGYMYRYNPGFRFLYEAVHDGWLGNVFEIHGVMSKTSRDSARRQMAQYVGGAMFELGCHLIDPLVHIMGTPTRVTPFNRKTREDDDLLDNTLAVFEYPGATATIRSALVEVDGFRRRQFVVCGDQGTIAIRPLEPPRLELTLARSRDKYQKGTTVVDLPRSPGRYHGAWQALAAAIRDQREFPYTPAHDFAVQKSILAASGVMAWQ